jgi:hypothetical protein
VNKKLLKSILSLSLFLIPIPSVYASNDPSSIVPTTATSTETSTQETTVDVTSLFNIAAVAEASGSFAPYTYGYVGPVDGQGQYGRVTLTSTTNDPSTSANVEVYYDGYWHTPDFNDSDFAFLDFGSGGIATTNFYMSIGRKYRLHVFNYTGTATGYIRAYD